MISKWIKYDSVGNAINSAYASARVFYMENGACQDVMTGKLNSEVLVGHPRKKSDTRLKLSIITVS